MFRVPCSAFRIPRNTAADDAQRALTAEDSAARFPQWFPIIPNLIWKVSNSTASLGTICTR